MPTRKQRRRDQKLRRHEWEEVYLDAEGNEVAVEEIEGEQAPRRSEARRDANGRARTPPNRASQGAGREVKPPSWSRVLKRSAIFAPIMFLVVSFLSKKLTVEQKVLQTAMLLAFFVPFSYLMDVVMYRSYLKRTGQATGSKKR